MSVINANNITRREKDSFSIDDFYFIKVKILWRFVKTQHFSFWMMSCYLFFEYTRPQSIFPVIDFLPWAQIFLIGALIGAFFDKTVKWVKSPINLWITLFAIIIFISSQLAEFPKISQSNFINFYGWFVIYFLFINIINTKERFYIVLLIFLFSAAKIAIGTSLIWASRGFSFATWGLKGPPGFFENSGELSILMLTLIPVAYNLYIHLKDRVRPFEKYLLLIFWVAPILTILGASSRGAQLALAVMCIFMFRKNIFKPKRLIYTAVLSVLLYSLIPETQLERFRTAGDDQTSQQRLLYWQHGYEMIERHPYFGVGFFNFAPYYERYFPEDMLYDRAQLPHNIFIQVGTDAGLIGLSIFLVLLITPFLSAYKINRQKHLDPFLTLVINGMTYGIFGFIIAGQFVTVTYYPFFWIGLSFVVSGYHIWQKSIGLSNKAKYRLN